MKLKYVMYVLLSNFIVKLAIFSNVPPIILNRKLGLLIRKCAWSHYVYFTKMNLVVGLKQFLPGIKPCISKLINSLCSLIVKGSNIFLLGYNLNCSILVIINNHRIFNKQKMYSESQDDSSIADW